MSECPADTLLDYIVDYLSSMIRSLRSRLKELEEQTQPADQRSEAESSMTVEDVIIVPDQCRENQVPPNPEVTAEAGSTLHHSVSNTTLPAPPITSIPTTVNANTSSAPDRQSLEPTLAANKPPS